MPRMRDLKIAVIHDWLTVNAGAEKVLQEILNVFPRADIFTVYFDPDFVKSQDFLKDRKITQTFVGRLPFVKQKYRNYLPFMPIAIEQLDVSGYDLVLSSSHAVAKGVLTGPDQLHISYIYSPIRYAWDLQHQYLKESGLTTGLKGWIAKWILHKIRIWDYRTAAGVDHMIADSKFISKRIKKVYGRESVVIYPPVDVVGFGLVENKHDYYLTASRMVPYKRMDLIVEAFAKMPDKKLVVIGDGPEMDKIKSFATSNVQILGYQSFEVLRTHMQNAKAFVFAAEEDFGITPLEAQACGTPVIAYGKGGALETVVDCSDTNKATGIWFKEQTVDSLISAVDKFENLSVPISPRVCRAHSETFGVNRFRSEILSFVTRKFDEFKNN
jgi:glycosyltransferase involved in cell wall biosynthesis